jgi:16S rRNA (uracil1498-N3)-methyltransferase
VDERPGGRDAEPALAHLRDLGEPPGTTAVAHGDRLARVAREAAMQSRRARLPEVREPEPLAALASHPGLIVARAGGRSAADVVATTPGPEWLIVAGPEGGFDDEELASLAAGTPLGVGPHVLRSVTAPVAALAALVGFRK